MKLRKCEACFSYTMMDMHCGIKTKAAHPAKYSLADKYALYRRRAKYG